MGLNLAQKLKGFISLFCEGSEDDEVETELLFTSEKLFPPWVLLDEEVPEKSWLVLVI